jgi:hypothetical protein
VLQARQEAGVRARVLEQISVLCSIDVHKQPAQHAEVPSNVIKLESRPTTAALTSLVKRAMPLQTVAAAKKAKTEELPPERLIQVQRIAGSAVRLAGQQAAPTVQVWRIMYKGQQYFVEVDAVLLLGNGFNRKLFSRVSVWHTHACLPFCCA